MGGGCELEQNLTRHPAISICKTVACLSPPSLLLEFDSPVSLIGAKEMKCRRCSETRSYETREIVPISCRYRRRRLFIFGGQNNVGWIHIFHECNLKIKIVL
uniref:Uncharacterized protein n=1 Tax=Romanomermis culicivorax TaxID=13658 RepID=A0A915IIV2_ROMCU